MYARGQGGRDLTFDFGEGLLANNLLLVDRETESVWSQLAGKAVSGALEGTPLRAIPSLQTTWKFWRQRHPDTRVMILPDTDGRPYLYSDFTPGEPRRESGDHDTSTLGLGLAVGDDAWFFPLHALADTTSPVRMEIGGQPVVIHHDTAQHTAWAEDADGELMTGVLAYEAGWREFFPETNVWTPE